MASSEALADVAQDDVGVGLARELLGERGAERSARAGDRNDTTPRSFEQVPAVDVEHGAGDERRRVGREELVRAGEVGRCSPPPWAVWPSTSAARSGRFFQPSASGESNHPGATTLTVMPDGARSSASALAIPTSPAFEAL